MPRRMEASRRGRQNTDGTNGRGRLHPPTGLWSLHGFAVERVDRQVLAVGAFELLEAEDP